MNRITQSFFFLFILTSAVFCQDPDSIITSSEPDSNYFLRESDSIFRAYEKDMYPVDTVVYEEPDFSHSSKKAIMYALVLPGLGQAYNTKYFKIPIVLAAFGGVGYAIVFNTNQYRESTANYIALPNEETKWYLDTWRRNLELSYIGLIVVYALQVLDAYVDAQLYSWDVNENLSLRIAPSLQPMMAPIGRTGQVYGLSCSFDFKRR